MRTPLEWIALLHFVAGAAALGSFWIPALSRKGGPIHRRAGRVYVVAMWAVSATALPLAMRFFLEGRWIAGTFLAYLLLITVTALHQGMRALKSKRSPADYADRTFRVLAWLNLAGGATVLIFGLTRQVWLLAGFSLIGLFAALDALRFIRRPPSDARFWMREHLGGMIGTGMAAHVAFLNFGASRLIPGYDLGSWGMLAWFLPVAIGVAATIWATNRYAPVPKSPDKTAASH